jgi:acetoin utilization deacetylase AcuC-like enzyme
MTLSAVYAPSYFAPTPTPSMRKLPFVARAVVNERLAQLFPPTPVHQKHIIAKLQQLHAPVYVSSFLEHGPLAERNGFAWSPALRDGVLALNAGQLTGTDLALKEGIAANIAQGFHHALFDSGGGFCTFNGLALVAQELAPARVYVLDCDEHQGNGTEDFTRHLPSLFAYSIHGSSFGCSGTPQSISHRLPRVTHQFHLYRSALARAFADIIRTQPRLLLYQAGVDCHQADPYGSLGLTTEQLYERDYTVFRFCKTAGIPVLFVLAGGYQEPLEERLVPLHVQTFRAAQAVYG